MADERAVYVVEDNQVAREAIARMLACAGLSVKVYPSAEPFLEDDEASGVGCLVLDLGLPGMSGLELLEKLVAEGSQVPVIIVSAHVDAENVIRAKRLGALDFIKKPYRASVLLGRIREALRISGDVSSRPEHRSC